MQYKLRRLTHERVSTVEHQAACSTRIYLHVENGKNPRSSEDLRMCVYPQTDQAERCIRKHKRDVISQESRLPASMTCNIILCQRSE